MKKKKKKKRKIKEKRSAKKGKEKEKRNNEVEAEEEEKDETFHLIRTHDLLTLWQNEVIFLPLWNNLIVKMNKSYILNSNSVRFKSTSQVIALWWRDMHAGRVRYARCAGPSGKAAPYWRIMRLQGKNAWWNHFQKKEKKEKKRKKRKQPQKRRQSRDENEEGKHKQDLGKELRNEKIRRTLWL